MPGAGPEGRRGTERSPQVATAPGGTARAHVRVRAGREIRRGSRGPVSLARRTEGGAGCPPAEASSGTRPPRGPREGSTGRARRGRPRYPLRAAGTGRAEAGAWVRRGRGRGSAGASDPGPARRDPAAGRRSWENRSDAARTSVELPTGLAPRWPVGAAAGRSRLFCEDSTPNRPQPLDTALRVSMIVVVPGIRGLSYEGFGRSRAFFARLSGALPSAAGTGRARRITEQ